MREIKARLATADKGEAVILTPALVTAHLENNETDAAMDKAMEAVELARELDDKRGEATMLQKVAEVHLAEQEYESAIGKATEALDLFQDVGDKVGEASVQAVLTAAYTASNQAHKAPHRVLGLEQLGRLTEATSTRNKQLFFEAFERLNASLGVDKHDYDAVLKPLFRKDPAAEEFYKETVSEFHGVEYVRDTKAHLNKGKCCSPIETFLG